MSTNPKPYSYSKSAPEPVGHMVVRPHRPLVFRGVVVVLGVLLALAGYGLYELGRFDAGFSAVRSELALQDMQGDVARLGEASEQLGEQVGVLEGTLQVERQAFDEVRRMMDERERELRDLRQEVAFYRGIMAGSGNSRGLTIQDFRLNKVGTQGRYTYLLVLTQVVENNRDAEGSVKISIAGTSNGEPRTLTAEELLGKERAAELRYDFRYFQKLHGSLELPAGFKPASAVVYLEPKKSKIHTPVEHRFEWQALMR